MSLDSGCVALSGQLGDTVGGFSNLVSMVLVAYGLWYARGEFSRSREQHRRELAADAARRIFQAVNRHAMELTAAVRTAARQIETFSAQYAATGNSRQGILFDTVSGHAVLQQLETSHRDLEAAFSDAHLFAQGASQHLESLEHVHGEVLDWIGGLKTEKWITLSGRENEVVFTPVREFEDEIHSCVNGLQAVLGPIARHEDD